MSDSSKSRFKSVLVESHRTDDTSILESILSGEVLSQDILTHGLRVAAGELRNTELSEMLIEHGATGATEALERATRRETDLSLVESLIASGAAITEKTLNNVARVVKTTRSERMREVLQILIESDDVNEIPEKVIEIYRKMS
jgi:hypothetical protein